MVTEVTPSVALEAGTAAAHMLQTRKQSPRSKPGLRIAFTSLWKSSRAFQTVPQAGDQVVHGGTSQVETTAKSLTLSLYGHLRY